MRRGQCVPLGVLALCAAVAFTSALAAGDTATARITVDTAGPSTRLVLTFSRGVATTVTASAGKIEVACSEPVVMAPLESKLDDPLLKAWSMRGDRTLVLTTGPGYQRFESFDLKNPFRLVMDLQGSRPPAPEAAAAARRPAPPKTIIVIDPGHGGVETGATGPAGSEEKDLTLELARKLDAALEKSGPISVVLTRDGDRVVSLDERAAIANHNRADLFLSLHLNAAKRRGAVGAETYFLSPDATDDEARTLAALENRASGVEQAPPASKEGDRGLDLILWDLAQNQYLGESSRLAESVQKELNELAGTRDRGVRQAPFRVLMGATMPAVLVEAGFITNPEEEARLKDPAYQDKIVEAISRAVNGFLKGRARLQDPGFSRP